VWAPENAGNVSLPVMFWIFGGGYVIGDGVELGFYEGKNLAKDRNVVVIAPNYREFSSPVSVLRHDTVYGSCACD
jgi:para-nitrobenzyl esterase